MQRTRGLGGGVPAPASACCGGAQLSPLTALLCGNATPVHSEPHSFMEIYLDQIRDLGAAAQAHLKATAARSPPPIPGDAAASAGLGLSAYAADGGGAPGRSTATSLGAAADYVRTNLDVLEDSSGMTFVKDLTFMEVSGRGQGGFGILGSEGGPAGRRRTARRLCGAVEQAWRRSLASSTARLERLRLVAVQRQWLILALSGTGHVARTQVSCVEDMLAVLRAGYALRATSATAANDVSSRSHTVFTVSVVTYRGEQQPVTGA